MRVLLSCILALGCRPADAPPAPVEDDAAPASVEAAPAKSVEAPAVAPANDDAAVLRAVLTHERFAEYLHPDVAGRVPVIVSGDARPRGPIDLELHGAKVSVQAPAAVAGNEAVVSISEWSIDRDTARVAFTYPVEGVVASFALERTTAGWRVTTASVAER